METSPVARKSAWPWIPVVALALALALWALPAAWSRLHGVDPDASPELQRIWNWKWAYVYLDAGLAGLLLAIYGGLKFLRSLR